MRRGTFLRRMAYAAAGVGLLGIELGQREPRTGFEQLAEDMATFVNPSPEEAIERISQALDAARNHTYLKTLGVQP